MVQDEGVGEELFEIPCSSNSDKNCINKPPQPGSLRRDDWEWYRDQRTHEVEVNGKSVMFHPLFAFGTAAVRGTKALTASTTAYWEIKSCSNIFGTSVMFGVGNGAMQLNRVSSFTDLLGKDGNSYGLNHHGMAFHNGLGVNVCEPIQNRADCVVGVLFDGPRRQISYYINGVFVGTPFTDIETSEKLYPMVSSTAQQSEFLVQNQGSLQDPSSLLQVSLRKVHTTFREKCSSLPLPASVKSVLISMERNRKHRTVPAKKRISKRVPNHVPLWIHAFRYSMGVEDDQ